MANLAPGKFTIQTDQTLDFSNVHNFVKNFVWDPIQSTYCNESRGASFAPKNVRRRTKKEKSFRVYCMVQYLVLKVKNKKAVCANSARARCAIHSSCNKVMGLAEYFCRPSLVSRFSNMVISYAKPCVAAPGAGLAGKPMGAQA